MNQLCTTQYLEYRDRVAQPTNTTCDWFLRHSKYLEWRKEPRSSLLWYSADPGCGKSVLSSFLVDELQSPASQTIVPGTVCYFFFRDDSEAQSSATNAICALLHQLLSARHDLVRHFLREYQIWGSSFRSNFSALWRTFISLVLDVRLKNVICVLDGLDECESTSCKKLLDSITRFFNEEAVNYAEPGFLKVFVSSRPYTWIERSLRQFPEIRLKGEEEIASIDRDVSFFVERRMQDIAQIKQLPPDTQASVQSEIIALSSHTFLWAALVLNIIEDSASASRISLMQILKTLPPSLDAVYERILSMSPDVSKTRKIIHIVLGAEEPLSLDDMNIALNIHDSHRSCKALEPYLEPNIESTIKDLCGLFVRIINSQIYLVHQTARFYLLAESQSKVGPWKHSFDTTESNYVLSKICMTYRSFTDIYLHAVSNYATDSHYIEWEPEKKQTQIILLPRDGLPESGEHNKFEYFSARWWYVHFKRSEAMHSHEGVKVAARLCNPEAPEFEFLWTGVRGSWAKQPWDSLQIASFLGLMRVVDLILGEHAKLPSQESLNSAANIAVQHGNLAIAQALFNSGADARTKVSMDFLFGYQNVRVGDTLLHHAVRMTDQSLAKLLIDCGADINAISESGTPILHLATTTSLEMVDFLLRQGADIGVVDDQQKSVLRYTANVDVVNYLIEHGANVDSQDCEGNTLLHEARSLKLIQALLEAGADPGLSNAYGENALHALCALMYPPPQLPLMVDALLGRVDPNAMGYEGNTALHYASKPDKMRFEPFLEIIQLLIKHGCDVDVKNDHGDTVLLCTSSIEDLGFLLQQGANISEKDEHGQTICHRLQSSKGVYLPNADKILQACIDSGGIDALTARDENGRTPLHIHAELLGTSLVKMLLRHPNVDINSKDNQGQTPFSRVFDYKSSRKYRRYRTRLNYIGIIRLFAKTPGILLNEPDFEGRTPLSYASQLLHPEILVELQYQYATDVDFNLRDFSGRSALSYAADFGCAHNVSFLLCRLRVTQEDGAPSAEPLKPDNAGIAPFQYAFESEDTLTITAFFRFYLIFQLSLRDRDQRSPDSESHISWYVVHGQQMVLDDEEKREPITNMVMELTQEGSPSRTMFINSMRRFSGPIYEDRIPAILNKVLRQYLSTIGPGSMMGSVFVHMAEQTVQEHHRREETIDHDDIFQDEGTKTWTQTIEGMNPPTAEDAFNPEDDMFNI